MAKEVDDYVPVEITERACCQAQGIQKAYTAVIS